MIKRKIKYHNEEREVRDYDYKGKVKDPNAGREVRDHYDELEGNGSQ